jgi:hypothetical protein
MLRTKKYGTRGLRVTASSDNPLQATDKRRCIGARRGYLDVPFVKIAAQAHQALGV